MEDLADAVLKISSMRRVSGWRAMRERNREDVPVSSVVDGFMIDQSFLALLVCCDLMVTSAKMSSLSSGLAVFFTGRLDRKSSSSSSRVRMEDLAVAFAVTAGDLATVDGVFSRWRIRG